MSTISHMQIITGGAYGTVRLWSIPSKKQGGKRRRRCCISELNAKCVWSIPVFAKGEGVCDMLLLPAPKATTTSPAITTSTTTTTKKPLVLLSGGSSSTLVLLDTNKCTRKAFSTSVTPTVVASWNLHQLASLELSKIDKKAQLPERRWISASNMRLIEYRQLRNEDSGEGGSWWCKIGIVSRCGWVFVAELGCRKNNIPRLSIHIIHHTPRIQCFNSSNERLTTLGGMALQFSLPSGPVASSNCIRMSSNNMIWLSNVNAKKYTLPSKDKYVLCEDYDTLEVMEEDELVTPGRITSSSENSMILVNLDEGKEYYDGFVSRNTVTRLPLPMNSNPPLALATHPSGEWMVIGCGGRGDSSELKLISMRMRGHTL